MAVYRANRDHLHVAQLPQGRVQGAQGVAIQHWPVVRITAHGLPYILAGRHQLPEQSFGAVTLADHLVEHPGGDAVGNIKGVAEVIEAVSTAAGGWRGKPLLAAGEPKRR